MMWGVYETVSPFEVHVAPVEEMCGDYSETHHFDEECRCGAEIRVGEDCSGGAYFMVIHEAFEC